MYYFTDLDASLVINVNRLDRDNKSQSTTILGIVSKVIQSQLAPHAAHEQQTIELPGRCDTSGDRRLICSARCQKTGRGSPDIGRRGRRDRLACPAASSNRAAE